MTGFLWSNCVVRRILAQIDARHTKMGQFVTHGFFVEEAESDGYES
jgi:hypothetical protein